MQNETEENNNALIPFNDRNQSPLFEFLGASNGGAEYSDITMWRTALFEICLSIKTCAITYGIFILRL